MKYTQLTSTQANNLLSMYDYCNGKMKYVITDDLKIFEKNGMLSLSDCHWYQLTVEFVMPILIPDQEYRWRDRFVTVCVLNRSQHPVDYLYELYLKQKEGLKLSDPLPDENKILVEKQKGKKEDFETVVDELEVAKKEMANFTSGPEEFRLKYLAPKGIVKEFFKRLKNIQAEKKEEFSEILREFKTYAENKYDFIKKLKKAKKNESTDILQD